MRNQLIIAIFLIHLFNLQLFSQHVPSSERGDPALRKKTSLDANDVRVTVMNHGHTGRYGGVPIYEQTPYEWPKNSGQVYLAQTTVFIGAEVVDKNGVTVHIIDVDNGRSSPQGTTWNFEPVSGYFNPVKGNIANSNDPESWPDFWPDRLADSTDPGWSGSWDGYLGKNRFIEGQELYYKMSDDRYDRYEYYPDETDLTRKGLGLLVKGRVIELTDPIARDIVFQIYEIKNDGTKPLNKLAFTFGVADFVGGDGDSQDDISDYDLTTNLLWCYDYDGFAPTFGNNPVGMFGVTFLKTPKNIEQTHELGINSLWRTPAGGLNINSDETMWFDFMTAGKFYDPRSVIAGEYDLWMSSLYFELQPGETTEFVIAIILANGATKEEKVDELYRKLFYAQELLKSSLAFENVDVEINNPAPDVQISGASQIDWSTDNTSGTVISHIHYSDDAGSTWKFLAKDTLNSGQFSWDTNELSDGILYKLLIHTFAENGIGRDTTEGIFTINNLNKEAPPQILFLSPEKDERIAGEYKISWIAGDADGTAYLVNIYYKLNQDTDWIPLALNIQNSNEILWNTNNLPNSDFYEICGEVISTGETVRTYIAPVKTANERQLFEDAILNTKKQTIGTGQFEIRVVDQNEISGDSYSVRFKQNNDGPLMYDVYNLTQKQFAVQNATEVDGMVEGPYYDGIRLMIQSDPLEFDAQGSGWKQTDVYSTNFNVADGGSERVADYQLIVGEVGIDTSKAGSYLGIQFPAKRVNFKLFNLTENRSIDFIFAEIDSVSEGGAGRFTSRLYSPYPQYPNIKFPQLDRIIFLESDSEGVLTTSYYLEMPVEDFLRNPYNGDTLVIHQLKPFVDGDSILFSTQNIVSVPDDDVLYPEKLILYQNYPNPFNATTTISYYLAKPTRVHLTIYNILGQKTEFLFEGKQTAGSHSIVWNAGNLASGLYFVRLETGGDKVYRKIILMK